MPPEQLIMPWDGIAFDANAQNIKAKAIIVQLQGGQYVTVWPFHLATKPRRARRESLVAIDESPVRTRGESL